MTGYEQDRLARVTNCPGFLRLKSILALKVPHPEKPLHPRHLQPSTNKELSLA